MKQEELEIGSTFAGRFLVERRIGAGGMGVVYQVRHQVLRRTFAIKLMRGKFARDPSTVARFQREARAASRIDHPNILSVLDFGRTQEGSPYLVMEYIEGDDLALILSRERRLSIARTLDIVAQIADALISAHAQKVVHRDLKPDNVLLTVREGRLDFVKILDFGLAKITDASSAGASHGVFGTPGYMSPEQCLGRNVDGRTDIYSLGALAYHLLCGRPPFQGTAVAQVHGHLKEEPLAPSASCERRDITPGLDRLVLRCLAKRPEDRFSDALSLCAEVQSLLAAHLDQLNHEHGCPPRRTRGLSRPMTAIPRLDRDDAATASVAAPRLPVHDERQEAGLPRRGSAPHRIRTLEEIVTVLRDRGLGNSDLVCALAERVLAEDGVLRVAGELECLQNSAGDIDAIATGREAPLVRALNLLENERLELLAQPDDPARTQPWPVERSGDEVRPGASELDQKVREIAVALEAIDRERRSHQAELQRRIEETARRLGRASAQRDAREQRLLDLIDRLVAEHAHVEPDLGPMLAEIAVGRRE